jgi:hypothetical protein
MSQEVQEYKAKVSEDVRKERSTSIYNRNKVPVIALAAKSATLGPSHVRYEVSPEFTVSQFNLVLRK